MNAGISVGMKRVGRRLERERRTIARMIGLYCRGHGHPAVADGLCASCGGLLAYAMQRVQKCPFQEDKPTCARCPIHCYQPRMRETVRAVMRYAGPRMLLRHPLLTAMHYVDEWTRKRERPGRSPALQGTPGA